MTQGFDARDIAFEVLTQVDRGQKQATRTLDAALFNTHGLDDRDRGFVTELVYGVLRHLRRVDRVLKAYSRRSLKSTHPLVLRALRLAVYQLLFMDRVPPRAAVHGAVGFVQGRLGKAQAGFVNALLRSFLRKGEPPLPHRDKSPSSYLREALSYSDWMAGAFEKRLGIKQAVELGEALDKPYETVLCANTLKITRQELKKKLEERGVGVELCAWAPQGLRVTGLMDPTRNELHDEGLYSVQEEASQLVSHLLEPKTGQKILDACGGAGGKCVHMAMLVGAEATILCTDSVSQKLETAKSRFERAVGKSLDTKVVDWTHRPNPLAEERFHRVLLDAPCTGIGSLRRHPEAKWRLDEGAVSTMAQIQATLLRRVASEVAPGGVLVYAVCTLTEREGPMQVASFLEEHDDFEPDGDLSMKNPIKELIDAAGQLMLWPHKHGTDGFYAARLKKKN